MNIEPIIEQLVRFQNTNLFGAELRPFAIFALGILLIGLLGVFGRTTGFSPWAMGFAPNSTSEYWTQFSFSRLAAWLVSQSWAMLMLFALVATIVLTTVCFLLLVVFKPIPLDTGLEAPIPKHSQLLERVSRLDDPNTMFASETPPDFNLQKYTCETIKRYYDKDFQCATERGTRNSELFSNKYSKPENLIVFVHGWQGDETTWKKLPEFLRKDRRFINYAIVNEPYQQFIIKRNAKIYQIAQTLRDRWSRYAKLKNIKKVFFVSHSMGGVVVREIYILNDLAKVSIPIAGHISLATPYGGAGLGKLAAFFGINRNLLVDLAKNSDFLERQQAQWKLQDPKGTWDYCIGSHGDGVVSVESAQRGCKRNGPLWAGYGHKEIVKPDKANDERYQTIAETILLDGAF